MNSYNVNLRSRIQSSNGPLVLEEEFPGFLTIVVQEINVVVTKRVIAKEICTLLGYYTASSGNSLQTFRDNL